MKKITTDEFIKKAKDVHGDKYDYSLVDYKGSKDKVKIICKEHGIFEQIPNNHLNSVNCPKCGKNNMTTDEFIAKAKDVHGDKYDYSLVDYINNRKKIKIICPIHGEFEQASVNHLNRKQGCPKCAGKNKSTTEEFIENAKEIYGDKYDYSLVDYKHSKIKVKIICSIHGEFEQTPNKHLSKQGCPKCGYEKKANDKRSTNDVFIEKAKKIHSDKYDYSLVDYINNRKKIKIICPIHGEFEQASVNHLNRKHGCPKCAGKNITTDEFIAKAKDIHGDKYDYSLVDYKHSQTKVKIICLIHGEFEQTPAKHLSSGQGCPICFGFTNIYKLKLINDLQESDLLGMDPIQLSIIIQQGKVLPDDFKALIDSDANSEDRIKTLKELKKRFEIVEEEKETTLSTESLECITESSEEINQSISENDKELVEIDDVDDKITSTEVVEKTLPLLDISQELHMYDKDIYAALDEETIDSLVQYQLRKTWNKLLNKKVNIDELRNEIGGKYFTKIKNTFIEEYDNVSLIEPSKVKILNKDKEIEVSTNFMQKLTVYRLLKNKYYGNWSGTGAGKTISFILASRNIDAKLTVVIALNSTIKKICEDIKTAYPDSKCYTQYNEGYIFDRNKHNYLVLNYEKFQQNSSERLFQSLTNNNQIDFVVIDEVHNSKQRNDDEESIRRGVMVRLLGRARKNDNLHVLAMSATPVINNLYEAKSLLSLMSGLEYEDLNTTRKLNNAIKMFQQLTLNGLRYIPEYDINIEEITLEIDGTYLLDNILKLGQYNYLGLEKLLIDEKLKEIKKYLRKGVIIYSYFTNGIINKVSNYIEKLGFKVGTYTGKENPIIRESNLDDFISGKLDILIGSRPIGTGVDKLQYACNRMVCLTLPWTDSEYTQLKGRIYRQGSVFKDVEIITPQVIIKLENDEIWSWDIQRMNLIKNKKTLADAAVDGIIPSKIIPSPETMYKKSVEHLQYWKDRINKGEIITTKRSIVDIELYPEVNDSEERERKINSELQEFNRRGKTLRSETMHKEFIDNPDSWFRYHALRHESMKEWNEIPYEYIANKIKYNEDVVVDFGCGENLFKNCIPQNKVYSFDHVAIDDTVIACDMKDTGLTEKSIDIAVFSLALWGSNSDDYIKEAYRILNRRGSIYIAEPTSTYDDEKIKNLIYTLDKIGFKILENENRGKFFYITAIKI